MTSTKSCYIGCSVKSPKSWVFSIGCLVVKKYHEIKTFVQDVLKQRLRQLSLSLHHNLKKRKQVVCKEEPSKRACVVVVFSHTLFFVCVLGFLLPVTQNGEAKNLVPANPGNAQAPPENLQ